MTHLGWYTARSAGLVAWVLLTASTCWGLGLSGRMFAGRKPRPHWVLDLHRYLGGLATAFTGVHVAGVVADSYLHFGLADVLVPFASGWRPAAVAWGVVGLWLLVAVEATSLARRWLPRTLWRRVHYLSLPLFAFATLHGLTAGSDTTSRAGVVAAVGASAFVAALVVARWQQPDSDRSAGRQPASRGSVAEQGRPVPAERGERP
jgi:predicted lysophospholipase L1 biosynthesis ABC-type transport system permease subunit